jgi:glutaredoxin-related protein
MARRRGRWSESSERLKPGRAGCMVAAMDRLILDRERIAPDARAQTASFHRAVVEEVAAAVAKDHLVVVGMAGNPHVKKARKQLSKAGLPFTYLEYGSYVSGWKTRLAIKLWAGFPTFPMCFVDGTLIGGAAELAALGQAGTLR